MFRNFHTSINYALLIRMQANQIAFGPVINRKAELRRHNKKVKMMLLNYGNHNRYKTFRPQGKRKYNNPISCREE